jgi:hypothetical protein
MPKEARASITPIPGQLDIWECIAEAEKDLARVAEEERYGTSSRAGEGRVRADGIWLELY